MDPENIKDGWAGTIIYLITQPGYNKPNIPNYIIKNRPYNFYIYLVFNTDFPKIII